MCGTNWEIWHGSLFTAATAPTGGITLVGLYSGLLGVGRWNGGYIRNSPLFPLGYPLRQRISQLGDRPIPSLVR